jgi:superoxide reductase
MNTIKKFYKCEHCGNFATMLYESGVKMVCCGQPMGEVVANSVDAAQEKHVPALTRAGEKLTVNVGSVLHPMTAEHHIAWIIAAQEERSQRVVLDPAGSPTVEFAIGSGPVTVYAYCNLHGLWKAEA